jgi:hypothetical protein
MGIKCERCGRDATVNLQKLWVTWNYNARTERYSRHPAPIDDDDPIGEESMHMCNDCLDLWRAGRYNSSVPA